MTPITTSTTPPERGTLAWWEETVSVLEADWISLATMAVSDPPTPGQLQRVEALLAAIHAASAPPSQEAHRIDYQNGTVDDVHISCDTFRLEQMDKGCWWAAAIRGRRHTMFNLLWDKKRRDIVVTVYEDSIGCSDDTTQADGGTGEDGQ